MGTEDFSFPRICDNCASYGIDSPPLWNLSPAASPNSHYQGDDEKNGCFEERLASMAQRKSLSEEPMDLLWEGFNEELSPSKTTRGFIAASSCSSSRELVKFKCSRTVLTVAKANNNKGSILQARSKPGMVVIVKVLKKLFFLNNAHGKLRRRAL